MNVTFVAIGAGSLPPPPLYFSANLTNFLQNIVTKINFFIFKFDPKFVFWTPKSNFQGFKYDLLFNIFLDFFSYVTHWCH